MGKDEHRKTGKSAASLMEAKVRVDRAVESYSQSQRMGRDVQVRVAEDLHNAVVGWWWRMQPHIRDEDGWVTLGTLDAVEADAVFAGTHPQTDDEVVINGLRDVGDWVNKQATMTQTHSGPLSSRTQSAQTVTLRLPPKAALNAAKALLVHFNDAGWTASHEEQTHLDEPDPSHLEGLLLARGQTKAADQLPERFRGNAGGGA